MRIKVSSTNPSGNPTASGLRGLLQQHDFQIVENNFTFHIEVEEIEHTTPQPIVDGVDSEFERRVVAHLAALAGSVLIQRAGGVQREDVLKISIETNEDHRWWLQRAVYRALCEIRKDAEKESRGWFGKRR